MSNWYWNHDENEEVEMMKLSIKELVITAFCAALTAALAWVALPLPLSPVPVTGQTFGVIIAGSILKPRNAALSQIIYIIIGCFGLPVFAGGKSGLGTLLSPTGGYLWGFVIAACVISLCIEKFGVQNKLFLFGILTLGTILVIYSAGVFQLMLVTKITLAQALTTGVLPFLAGDLFKIILGTLLISRPTIHKQGNLYRR
ncbi:MAG: biotin transporter BioY [Firmicutes bacterium]|nr:biotin transporter BioY [Bacillota bacterium]